MEKLKILLADSSTFMRILLAGALETLGFEVDVAKNGIETLEKFTQCNPDITLIDLKLNGTNGIDVIRTLTRVNPSAIVVCLMQENMDDPDVIIEVVKAGAKSFMKKPTSGEEMKERLNKLVRRREEK